MNLRRPLTVIAALLASMLFAPIAWRARGAQATYTDTTKGYGSPWAKIEAQAKLESPGDANSVRALIREILNVPYSFGPIPPVMREIVEDRLVQAEMSYKSGRTSGIREETLVQLANTIADKMTLPDYARVTVHQVELLRFGMELSSPALMGPPMPPGADSSSSPGTGELSPAQATHILFVLTEQKISNPDYQLTPEEWEQTQYKPAMDRLLKYKELRDSGQLEHQVAHGYLVTGVHLKDFRALIAQRVSQMSLTEGMDIVGEMLKIAEMKK